MTLSSGVAAGSHTALTFLLAFGNSLTVFALCCGALSIIMTTFPKCPASSFRYRSTVFLSNFSYVLMNCLPSVAMEPYATTLPCRSLYVVTMGWPFGDQYCPRCRVVYEYGLVKDYDGKTPRFQARYARLFALRCHLLISSVPALFCGPVLPSWQTCPACALSSWRL